MAGIDKCYLDSYEKYTEFKEWAKDKTYVTPRGITIKLSDHIYDHWDEADFTVDGEPYERPIFNSPIHMDNYLWHNCPLEYIREWLSDRYCDSGYRKGDLDDIERDLAIPEYKPCTKVKVRKKGLGNCCYRYHRNGSYEKVGSWHIDVYMLNPESLRGMSSCWYNEDIDQWILPGEEDEWTSSCAHSSKSIRSIIRKIIKVWKLPVGCVVKIYGALVGDDWELITK